MNKKHLLSTAVTGILTVCAVIVTIAVVRREFFHETTQQMEPRHVEHWEDLASTGHLIGPSSAPIRIVVFSDFQCPFCRTLYFTLNELQARHPGQVAIVFRHFPVPLHPQAFMAAAATECADRQGKFETYYRALFEHQDSIGFLRWERFALMAGIGDLSSFRECLGSPSVGDQISRDFMAARNIGSGGAPTIVVRDQMLSEALPLDLLEVWIGKVYGVRGFPRASP
jgi:protein-disulfide isomerase